METSKDELIESLLGALSKNGVLEGQLNGGVKVPSVSLAEQALRLRKAFDSFSEIKPLHPGDLVTWKDQMKNKRKPDYGQLAIVVEVLEEPIFDEDERVASAYYGERLDVRLGFLDDEGDFVCFLFDSQRFKPYQW